MDKVAMGAIKIEHVCESKWPPVTRLVLSWQLTSIACGGEPQQPILELARWLQLCRKHNAPVEM